MRKKLFFVLCTMLFILTGCSNASNSLSKDNLYLAGSYKCQWDATEKYAREYYKLNSDFSFVAPSTVFTVEINLDINEDGTYKIYTNDDLTRFSFDMFLTDNTVYELELYNLCDGDSQKWTEYRNQNGYSTEQIIKKMADNLPIDKLSISDEGNCHVDGTTITFNNNSATIEKQNNNVRLKFADNTYTNSELNFIKK